MICNFLSLKYANIELLFTISHIELYPLSKARSKESAVTARLGPNLILQQVGWGTRLVTADGIEEGRNTVS